VIFYLFHGSNAVLVSQHPFLGMSECINILTSQALVNGHI